MAAPYWVKVLHFQLEAANRYHALDCIDDVVVGLREAQTRLDIAAIQAYGWRDIDLAHDFYGLAKLPANDRLRFTISEAARLEVLRRLAVLNRERYQEEQDAARGLQSVQAELVAPRKRAGRPSTDKKAAVQSAQTKLFE